MRSIVLSMVLLCSVFTAGCQFAPIIAPIVQLGIAWVEGEAHKYYNCDEESLREAVEMSLAELEFPISEQWLDDGVTHIRTGKENRFKIRIIPVRENVTKLSIRVNVMGDKPYAELIYRHVDEKPGVGEFTTLKALNTALKR